MQSLTSCLANSCIKVELIKNSAHIPPYILTSRSDGALAVTELATSKLTVMLEHFVAGSQQQLLQMPGYDGAAVLAAGAAAQSGQRPAPTNPLCCVDVSPADATLCAAAWRTHLVVFATPWDDSIVRMMALYKCEEVGGGCVSKWNQIRCCRVGLRSCASVCVTF